mgnify:CR=1 FL=1
MQSSSTDLAAKSPAAAHSGPIGRRFLAGNPLIYQGITVVAVAIAWLAHSLLEPIPWACRRLIVGTGADGALPIDKDVRDEARRLGVELLVLPTEEACERLADADPGSVNAILHVTC